MSNKTISSVFSAIFSAALGVGSASLVNAQEPIAFIGHGVMFDQEGKQIQASPEFIEKAQNYYIGELVARLQPAQNTKFNAERARLLDSYKHPPNSVGQGSDRQDTLIINSALIDWLIKEIPVADAGTLQGKNNLIKAKLRYRLFPPEIGAPYAAPKGLLDLLEYKFPEVRKNH